MQKIQKSKQFVEKMCHLYNSAIKLGGNIYEVAKQSGFLFSHNGWRKRKTGSA